MSKDHTKVLIGRFDLDGHDRGILSVIHALRNAGMEVVYIHFSHPREVVKSAIEEDADLIGITSSLGQHSLVASSLLDELQNSNAHIPVIMGGVIPSTDVPGLTSLGVKGIFGPGSTPKQAVSFISELV
ncbi:MAG: cobalamin-dependent protein [Chloroflexota bacterium]|nr:cobalamin-dependent protein [Chloroflexota bacterium]